MENKQAQLYKLNAKMLACSQCVLRGTCRTVVPGEGSAEAEIMFIGEGPGQKEDELGRPFVGAAGKFLDEMLTMIGLSREDVYPHTKITGSKASDEKYTSDQKNKLFGVGVYIANVVKCRPPGNRDPLPEEAEACWPWLVEQIKIIDPKLIVILGKHSLERFLPGKKISQVHGKALRREIPEIGACVFYALYHPAAALYNGGIRNILIEDFKKIPAVLEAAKKQKSDLVQENSEEFKPEENKQESLF
jgi:DNA polymerase